MDKLKLMLLAAAAAVLCACSGGSDQTLVAPPGGGPGAGTVASLTLLTSNPSIRSDGTTDATITALVRDSNNNVMSDIAVVLSASSGSLVVTQPAVTDDTGTVTAKLSTGGDPTVRTINVGGLAGASTQGSVPVRVTGVTVTIDGPANLSTGAQGGPYTVRVTDDPVAGDGIPNATVTITSTAGTPTPASGTTNANGEMQFTLTASNPGSGAITAAALGALSAPKSVTVSGDSFSFTAPSATPTPEVALGAALTVTTQWRQNGVGVANQPVTFATSRGTVSAASVNTNAAGDASITVSATNSGPAVITAKNAANAEIQLNIEFVATTPAVLELQAQPFTIPTEGQSTITAIVRDPVGNLVKNRTVSFVLDDVTGGSLSVAQATTNSVGRAQTVYRASTATSAADGVHVVATVQGFPAVTDTVALTVAQRELFISFGTGNSIDEPNSAQYHKEWVVQVTDAQGNGVPNAAVTFSVLSTRYWDGFRQLNLAGDAWVTALPNPAGCMDEDILSGNPSFDRNGVLDGVAEDLNLNGEIEAGNIASAAPKGGSGSTLVMNQNGFGIIDVYWPQEYAYYLEVELQARTSVQGTEFSATSTYLLDGSAADFNNKAIAPPGIVSPFGVDGSCSTPPPM